MEYDSSGLVGSRKEHTERESRAAKEEGCDKENHAQAAERGPVGNRGARAQRYSRG